MHSHPYLLFPGGGDDFYKGTDVVSLTDGNFDEEVVQSEDLWFVEVSEWGTSKQPGLSNWGPKCCALWCLLYRLQLSATLAGA